MNSSGKNQEALDAEVQQLVNALEGGFRNAHATGGVAALEAAIAQAKRLAGVWDKEALNPF